MNIIYQLKTTTSLATTMRILDDNQCVCDVIAKNVLKKGSLITLGIKKTLIYILSPPTHQ